MKRIARIILSIMFTLPMLVGGIFMLSTQSDQTNGNLYMNSTPKTENVISGEGGITDLIPQDPSDYPQPGPIDPPSVDPVTPEPVIEEITYDYTKTYEDYFLDYEVPTTFAESNVTGTGAKDDPYIIN